MAQGDDLFGPLKRATTAEERLRVLENIIAWWHGIVAPDVSLWEPETGTPEMPRPLLWWYTRFGRRLDLVRKQNQFLSPGELWVDVDEEEEPQVPRLVFYQENQNVYLWSTLPTGDDPPVWVRLNEDGEPWELEEESLSGFLIQAVLFEAIVGAPAGASASWLSTEEFEAIVRRMTPVPLGTWRWPAEPHRFYYRDGALLFGGKNAVHEGQQRWEIWVGARERKSLSFLDDLATDQWERRPS